MALAHAKGQAPSFQTVLGQQSGCWLIEFRWADAGGGNYHVVLVNCCLRVVLCNTLGAIPFNYAKGCTDPMQLPKAESAETHTAVARLFKVANMLNVWMLYACDA